MDQDPLARLLARPPELPVAAGLDELRAALSERGAAVVQAPPGSGKTTLVPPAVAQAFPDGRVVVTQPRRIAARAAARRLAHLLDEPVGRTVGFAVRGERVGGAGMRVEFVTTGTLLRRLQRDPELAGTAAMVLDEVHERQLDADLTLALLVDVRAHLRELPVVAMSATVEADRTATVLGGAGTPVPVITVPGALHPVAVRWSAPPSGVLRRDDRGTTPAFLDHVAATTRVALAAADGDVLVFVPGVGEVEQVRRRLVGSVPDVDVRPLHGRLTSAEQDLALSVDERRRVVVSTAVAESSLTVPGVRTVVDAGLSREPRTDQARQMAGLVTVRVSRAAAEQRAGRAGREGPGTAYRCWSEAEHAHLAAHPLPEMLTADLTSFALEAACWGAPGGVGLALLDPPPMPALDAALAALSDLGALAVDGTPTDRGRQIAGLGTDPRLARALLEGAPLVGARRAAEVVALLSDDVRAPGGDLVAALRALRGAGRGGSGGGSAGSSWASSTRRFLAALPEAVRHHPGEAGLGDDLAVGTVVALAHPDRIARRRPGSQAYLMVSGTGAVLPRGAESLASTEWIAIGDVERTPGARDAIVRSAAPLEGSLALEAASSRWEEIDDVRWSEGRIAARRVTRLGAIELDTTPLSAPDPALVAAALRDGLARDGLDVLRWTEAATALRARLSFLRRSLGAPWPDVSDEGLLADLDTWLGAELARVRSTRDLGRIDVLAGLRRLLPWPEAGRLDELAPERLAVPSGSSVRLDYAPDQPVLAVRVQEMYGATATPRLADGRVPVLLHLLSPAGRPAAVTADLASFWTTGYPGMRADLRGRYPKHSWPEDPATAAPLRGTKRAGPGR